ncbi:hypothetical protein U6A24_11090 [Aquimarina gracilis]|uniref:Cellobiose phosphorylase n=1 Tax=Aquimarina gracilis TaxID=874422 RepID=A0ABU5ZVV8_9FLAO|nr:hypothetical protein [Aquimarina gracilis]MEB3346010.1 hypothetical protein [Aquimarina gracilis]
MSGRVGDKEVKLHHVTINNETFYKISNCDVMRPFFMSIVSDSNHWMFISSNGGLSAGRKDSDNAIFPYYTDDKITESYDTTGSKTIFRIKKDDQLLLWEPFSERYSGTYQFSRNIYKNAYGNKILFEEIHHDLGLTYTYMWNSSNTYGFVKKSTLINNSNESLHIEIVDGLQNIMPYGVNTDLQAIRSNLVDAYKRSELIESSGLGIYALSSIIVDRAEPSEALKANTVWSKGLENPKYLLSSLQLDTYRSGGNVDQEIDVKAEKGAYFVNNNITLQATESKDWIMVANVNQGPSQVAEISEILKNDNNLQKKVNHDIELGTQRLINLVSASDGFQLTADKRRNARHYSNTLFNIMRGGIFDANYTIEKWDFINYLALANKGVYRKNEELLENFPETFTLLELREIAYQNEDKNFRRLALEYMPLKFSRRHGDPSRPWNKFSINTQSEIDGSKILDYEGNWRDIFQNWEALAHSYPEFVESMIYKFLNASTFDGYNPYRITKGGIDWEVIEEHDPWSYIGYWGDHQIIYLLKFLEFIQDHYPNRLQGFLNKNMFVYANVPYKIKPYEDLLKNPKDTIEFDYDLDKKIRKERDELGADGALLRDQNYNIHKVNFIEKILAITLAKLSNFIPEAGIWLNTQRPEWNDANNALVGNGVSMVTLYYLRRFFKFFDIVLENIADKDIEVSIELVEFYKNVNNVLKNHVEFLSRRMTNEERRKILDGLGIAGSNYRTKVYSDALSGKKETLKLSGVKVFIDVTLKYLNHSIDANKRDDNMYHAYNLMTIENENEISITYLDEMLEGQVAVLSSGHLSSRESLSLLDAMKNSVLFRSDQYSYLLYPNKELPKFTEKNSIPKEYVENSPLLTQLLADNNTQIIEKDINGNYHFNGNFNNAKSLKEALENLTRKGYHTLVEKYKGLVLETFEKVFNHKGFTGRSGTFYGYEGLGSIYWHMVSKLLLAVQECCLKAIDDKESAGVVGRLLEHYYEINEGIGVHKSPELYGAFPTDPYSHTPLGKGAQQPGMTGQVKEDILSRLGELGVAVNNGKLQFYPSLLRIGEFLKTPKIFQYVDVHQNKKRLQLYRHELAFTYCQVPVVYSLSGENSVEITYHDGTITSHAGLNLETSISQKLFERTGEIESIKVNIEKIILK